MCMSALFALLSLVKERSEEKRNFCTRSTRLRLAVSGVIIAAIVYTTNQDADPVQHVKHMELWLQTNVRIRITCTFAQSLAGLVLWYPRDKPSWSGSGSVEVIFGHWWRHHQHSRKAADLTFRNLTTREMRCCGCDFPRFSSCALYTATVPNCAFDESRASDLQPCMERSLRIKGYYSSTLELVSNFFSWAYMKSWRYHSFPSN